MIRIAGVVLPQKKHVRIALRSIYGIGNTRALQLCEQVGIDPSVKLSELPENVINSLQQAINDSFTVESELRRMVAVNKKRLIDLNCYRGTRLRRGLPIKGRTKTNAKTCKKHRGGRKIEKKG